MAAQREPLKRRGPWTKGHKRQGGRAKGTPNKQTREVKEMLLAGSERAGRLVKVPIYDDHDRKVIGWKWERTGEGGSAGFIDSIIEYYPIVFFNAIVRLLPIQLVGRVDGRVEMVFKTVQDFNAALRERGLPAVEIYKDQPPKAITYNPREQKVNGQSN